MSRNGERALAEAGHMDGTGWATRVEKDLADSKQRLEVLENRTLYLANGITRVDARITEQGKLQGTRHAELLGAIEGVRRQRQPSRPEFQPYGNDDADAITGVESIEQMARNARIQRARAAAKELEAKELEAALEARIRRWKQIAVGGVAVAAIVAPAVMQGLRALGVLK